MIRFDPHTGKFVLQAHCRVAYDHVGPDGVLKDEVAEGLGEVYLTPQQVAELAAQSKRAVSTWANPDGRNVTIGSRGEDWQLAWHGTGHTRTPYPTMIQGSDYREFISRLRAQGFVPMPLVQSPPPPPAGRY